MELERSVGLRPDGAVWLPERRAAVSSILLKLAAMGARIPADAGDEEVLHLTGDLFARYREQTRLLSEHLCPADGRIQRYIDGLARAAGLDEPITLPAETLILDRYGQARELSLPMAGRPKACSTSRKADCPVPPTRSACRSAPTSGCCAKRCSRPRA